MSRGAFPSVTISPDLRSFRLLESRLAVMETRVRRRVTNEALRPSAFIVKNRAKARAPRGPTGNLKRSHSVKTLPGSPPAIAVRPALPRGSHRFWIHEGTADRSRKSVGGKFGYITTPTPEQLSTGSINANPWFARAWNSVKSVAQRKALRNLWRVVRMQAVQK